MHLFIFVDTQKVERLSEDCATFVRMRIEEAALDFRLDPVLEQACHYEVNIFDANILEFWLNFNRCFHSISFSMSLYFCIVPYFYFALSYCIVSYCIVLYCIVLYCIILYCIVLYCIVLYYILLYCIVLYCIALYCIALYCIVFYRVKLSCIV